jgi:hypothetical protein
MRLGCEKSARILAQLGQHGKAVPSRQATCGVDEDSFRRSASRHIGKPNPHDALLIDAPGKAGTVLVMKFQVDSAETAWK